MGVRLPQGPRSFPRRETTRNDGNPSLRHSPKLPQTTANNRADCWIRNRIKVVDLYAKKGQHALHVRNGKGGKDRVVQFSSKMKKLILDYLEYRKSESEFLFPSKRAGQMTRFGISQVFKQWAQRARLPSHYSIHSLRHTYAVRFTWPVGITFGWFSSSCGIRASRQPLCTVL